MYKNISFSQDNNSSKNYSIDKYNKFKNIVDHIRQTQNITRFEFDDILGECDDENVDYLFKSAREVADDVFGKDIYVRGLIEFTNYCHNDCFYCGIRKSNGNIRRYRLSKDEILACAELGYNLGFRTFVLQGGEDDYFTDDLICEIITDIKNDFAGCAVTLSIGEKRAESYAKYRNAGADRYLLRHETADIEHYKKLHPINQTFQNRVRCLRDLKQLGYQTGCGFMVGSPYQNDDCLFKDLEFIKSIQPEMVGIGPYIVQKDTPFKNMSNGSVCLTLKLLSIVRLIHPSVLLPATTALATLDAEGRERGILAGCNVLMPNLSPLSAKKDYLLYDNKACLSEESASCVSCLASRISKIGYNLNFSRGDYKGL